MREREGGGGERERGKAAYTPIIIAVVFFGRCLLLSLLSTHLVVQFQTKCFQNTVI